MIWASLVMELTLKVPGQAHQKYLVHSFCWFQWSTSESIPLIILFTIYMKPTVGTAQHMRITTRHEDDRPQSMNT